MQNNWYNEQLFEHYGQRFKINNILFQSRTHYQELVIFENDQFGRVMALDGIIQTTTSDEYIYHEMMVHVPMLAHGHAKKILIIGGGDGGILREICKYTTMTHVTMVEIDPSVVEMSKAYLPSISNGAFDDTRLHLVIADALDFVNDCKNKFDVIIVDSTDPIGPAEKLFTDKFHHALKQCLNHDGIIVSQNGASFLQEWEFEQAYCYLSKLYQDPWFYLANVPTYAGGFMTLAWATDHVDYRQLSTDIIRERFDAYALNTQYYTPDIHTSAFHLPQRVLNKLNKKCD